MRPRARSVRKALWAIGLLLVLFAGSVAHHHDAFAGDGAANCAACELRQTTPVAPEALVAVAAPPVAEYAPPRPQDVPAPRPRPPLAEAPKTSPPA